MNRILLPLMICLLMLASIADADWFEKNFSKDSIYSKIDELTGSIESRTTFKTNVTAPVYLKVIGNTNVDPWLTPGSDWYLDLYIRPDLMANWVKVASYVQETRPSQEVLVTAEKTAEIRVIIYHPTKIEATLSQDLYPEDNIIVCNDTINFPASGIIKIENEYIKYKAKNYSGELINIIHGYMDTLPTHHPAGTKVELYSGLFHIPVIIAINASSETGGGGGAMHPSRSHIIDFHIAKGMPPYAIFSCTKWYNKVSVNASKSYDKDGEIVAYQWDWESDGIFDENGVTAEHVYRVEGYHLITLRVVDDDGMSSTYSYAVNIIMPPASSNILMMRFFGIPVWMWILILITIVIIVIGAKI